MYAQWNQLELGHLGVLRVRGSDARSFLQGQLSCDVARLGAAQSLLGGYHNPQGRVLALLRLIELGPEDILAVLPRELLAAVMKRLSGFILRSKVALADDSAAWRIRGLVGPRTADVADPAPPLAAQLPKETGAVQRLDDSLAVQVGSDPARWLSLSPAAAALPSGIADYAPTEPDLWHLIAIERGEAELCGTTSGEFVAQMLNLDLLGAISFDKGCYTGQEVIARAHYRGRVKRRLQRFRSATPLPLVPGDAGELADGRPFRVVNAVRSESGGYQFLAVAPFGAAAGEAAPAAVTLRLEATPLPLPYELPE